MKDNINPSHYKQGNIEVIDFILDQKLTYVEGNIIKYVSRYKTKNGLEDLKKAQWYLQKLMLEITKDD
jgi:adenine-specific DNA glycosylase